MIQETNQQIYERLKKVHPSDFDASRYRPKLPPRVQFIYQVQASIDERCFAMLDIKDRRFDDLSGWFRCFMWPCEDRTYSEIPAESPVVEEARIMAGIPYDPESHRVKIFIPADPALRLGIILDVGYWRDERRRTSSFVARIETHIPKEEFTETLISLQFFDVNCREKSKCQDIQQSRSNEQ